MSVKRRMLVSDHGPTSRVVETWWVEKDVPPGAPRSGIGLGSDEAGEARAREHQAKHGGRLRVIRMVETSTTTVYDVPLSGPEAQA